MCLHMATIMSALKESSQWQINLCLLAQVHLLWISITPEYWPVVREDGSCKPKHVKHSHPINDWPLWEQVAGIGGPFAWSNSAIRFSGCIWRAAGHFFGGGTNMIECSCQGGLPVSNAMFLIYVKQHASLWRLWGRLMAVRYFAWCAWCLTQLLFV